MTILSMARPFFSPLIWLVRHLRPRPKEPPFEPVTFADMQRQQRELFGEHVDRTPCRCPQCRQIRKAAS